MSDSSTHRTAPDHSVTGMPGGVPYIIGNEAAERFSFYGMKAILVVFMTKYLFLMGDTPTRQMNGVEATAWYHLFSALVYLTPILGAILADSFLGKYRTIIWLSMGYCVGHGLLALMGSVWNAEWLLFWGLVWIIIGAGGIKPCVSAHVGDQFGRGNQHLLPKIFNYFYWSINLGAFLSSAMTPWLLEWYGPHWAFGIPGVLMALATFVFWLGRRKFIHVPVRRQHFLAEITSAEGLRALGKLSIIYVFVAMFWALFDQTGSSWVLQAEDLDRDFLGVEWLPSQVQSINPILILLFIPLFTFIIYPAVSRVFPLTPLRKMSIGFFLTVGAFGLMSLVQEWIDAGDVPSVGWQFLAYVLLTAGEVMISIVCLEFSYSQAPRTMKSVIMGVFFLSVFLGNLFTAIVNFFIQVPSTLADMDDDFRDGRQANGVLVSSGFDGAEGTADDISLTYVDLARTKISVPEKAVILEGIERITNHREETGSMVALSGEKGQELLEGLEDSYGNQLRYDLVTRYKFKVWTPGPDNTPLTRWDIGKLVELDQPEVEESEGWWSGFVEGIQPETSWLDQRREELNIPEGQEAEREATGWFVGGQPTLSGAAYFWFFTWIMVGTALIFVIVAYFYKTKEYLHGPEDMPADR